MPNSYSPDMDTAARELDRAVLAFIAATHAEQVASARQQIAEANDQFEGVIDPETLEAQEEHVRTIERNNLNPYVNGWVVAVEFTTTERVKQDNSANMVILPSTYQSPIYTRGLLETVLDHYKD
jgi:hypothetical protein